MWPPTINCLIGYNNKLILNDTNAINDIKGPDSARLFLFFMDHHY